MIKEITEIIEARFLAEWTRTRVQYDNVDFKEKLGEAFIRMEIHYTDARHASTNRQRVYGFVNVMVATPKNTSKGNSNLIIDELKRMLDRYRSGNLRIMVGAPMRIGNNKEWYVENVGFPFIYDHCENQL